MPQPTLYLKKAGILNLHDYITQQNCLFAHDSINRNLPTPLLDNRINFVNTPGNTRSERLNQLINFRTTTILYGTRSITARAVKAWNDINIDLHHLKLQNVSKSTCKNKIFQYLLDKYDNADINIINNNNNNLNNLNINRNNNLINRRNNNNINGYNNIRVLQRGRNNYGRLTNWTGERMVSRWNR